MKKFIRQARLPRGAYEMDLSLEKSLSHFENKTKPEKWCKVHPTAYWDPKFPKCIKGFKAGENCEEGK